jgi:hypothetical protein
MGNKFSRINAKLHAMLIRQENAKQADKPSTQGVLVTRISPMVKRRRKTAGEPQG